MEQKHCLDLVFCLDASATAVSLFDGLRDHVCDLLDSLQGGRSAWDVRLDFLAYSTPYDFGEGGKRKRRTDKKHNGWQGMLFQSMRRKNIQLLDALYRPPSGTFAVLKQFVAPAFFTDDVGDFKRALANIEFIGDETPAVALDIAADYPFRPGADCLRVMILLTDEPLESGSAVAKSMGIYIMGTSGILLFAHEEKLLSADETRCALEKLRQANRHISEEVLHYALNKLSAEA